MDNVFKPEHMGRLDSEKRRKLLPPNLVLDFMNLQQGDTLLDIGAGTGYFAIPALNYIRPSGKLIAADVSEEMLLEFKRKVTDKENDIEYVICGNDSVPLPDHIADKVLLAFVFHEMDDKAKYLKEIFRLSKSTGTIAIVEWEKVPSPMGPSLDERLGYDDLSRILDKANITNRSYKKLNDYQYMYLIENGG